MAAAMLILDMPRLAQCKPKHTSHSKWHWIALLRRYAKSKSCHLAAGCLRRPAKPCKTSSTTAWNLSPAGDLTLPHSSSGFRGCGLTTTSLAMACPPLQMRELQLTLIAHSSPAPIPTSSAAACGAGAAGRCCVHLPKGCFRSEPGWPILAWSGASAGAAAVLCLQAHRCSDQRPLPCAVSHRQQGVCALALGRSV